MKQPKWIAEFGKEKSTRKRSYNQETRLAKQLGGKISINSGATFGQNDLFTDYAEIEAKTTTKDSYSVKIKDWDKLLFRTPLNKMSFMVIDFEKHKKSLAVIDFEDLKYLINEINNNVK